MEKRWGRFVKVVVGLGNPGSRYENTRHNVGFVVVDRLKERMRGGEWQMGKSDWSESKKGELMYWWGEKNGQKVELVKPLTFMNESGSSVRYLMDKHQNVETEDLYVVHDDLDIELGKYKIELGHGPKIHGGVNSIEEKLGSKEFWRVRVGVDSRQRENSNSKSETPNKFQISKAYEL